MDYYKKQQLRELAILNGTLREESPSPHLSPSPSVSPFNSTGMKRAKTGRWSEIATSGNSMPELMMSWTYCKPVLLLEMIADANKGRNSTAGIRPCLDFVRLTADMLLDGRKEIYVKVICLLVGLLLAHIVVYSLCTWLLNINIILFWIS